MKSAGTSVQRLCFSMRKRSSSSAGSPCAEGSRTIVASCYDHSEQEGWRRSGGSAGGAVLLLFRAYALLANIPSCRFLYYGVPVLRFPVKIQNIEVHSPSHARELMAIAIA